MSTTFGISDFWDRFGGQESIMIGRWYSRQQVTNPKQRLSTKRSQKQLRQELVSIALIVSVIGNYISLKAAHNCFTQGVIYVKPCANGRSIVGCYMLKQRPFAHPVVCRCVWLGVIAQSLKPVKLYAPCKQTQYCWPATPNIVGSCCACLPVA